MATVVNDRDVLIMGAAPRYNPPTDRGMFITPSSAVFKVASDGVTASPASFAFTATLLSMSGTVTWSSTGGISLSISGNSATLDFASFAAVSGTVTATITVDGQDYTAIANVSRVADGAAGTDGLKTGVARLYQWATSAPATPSGTSTFTWATVTNSGYTGGDGWSEAVPANPGTPALRLYVASMPVSASAPATTSPVSYINSTVEAWSQNGNNGNPGANGLQSTAATVYQWAATIPAGPAGSASYTWASRDFGAAPSGWALTPGTSPSAGMTLWAASVQITDSAANSSTAFNWSTAAIIAIGYSGTNGEPGRQGASYVTAYCASTTGSATSAPAQTSGKTSLPAADSGGIAGTWSATVPALSAGQYLYQSDGIYDPTTDLVTWSTPYWSSLKVATLSAITANLGAINAGSINLGGGTFTVDNDGNLVCHSIKIMNPDGSIMLQAGGQLNAANAAPGTLNSDLTSAIDAAKAAPGKGTAINDDPMLEMVSTAWTVDGSLVYAHGVNAGVGSSGSNFYTTAPTNAPGQLLYTQRLHAIDPSKTYSLTANLFVAAGNDRNMYIYVQFYDAAGTYVGSSSTGWGGTMSGYVYGGAPPTGTWSRQGGKFGAGTTNTIPDTVRTVQIGVIFQSGGSSSVEQAAQDIRLELSPDWSSVVGPDKPADNATVGAPAGTYVGSNLAEDLETIAGAQAKADAAHDAAVAAAAADAQAKADLAQTTANAYADGKVSDEEARAIADATAKANAAHDAAVAAAAADATAKANVAATTANWSQVADNDGKRPADNATVGAPAGTNVGSTPATTVESNAANGQAAYNAVNDGTTGLAQRMRSNAANILSGGAGLAVGSLTWDGSGARTGGYGLGLNANGLVHYAADGTLDVSIGSSGVAVKGDITGSTGTFYGALSAVTGTFAGSLSAATGSFAGSLSAVTGNFYTLTIASGGYLRSANFVSGSSGFSFNADGSAELGVLSIRGAPTGPVSNTFNPCTTTETTLTTLASGTGLTGAHKVVITVTGEIHSQSGAPGQCIMTLYRGSAAGSETTQVAQWNAQASTPNGSSWFSTTTYVSATYEFSVAADPSRTGAGVYFKVTAFVGSQGNVTTSSYATVTISTNVKSSTT